MRQSVHVRIPVGKRLPMTVSEKIFQDQVIKLARMQQWLVFHASPSSPRPGVWRSDGNGFPDLVLVSTSVPSRGVIFCELKAAEGKLSAEQEKYARCLINAGIEYHLWRPRDLDAIAARLGRQAKIQ